MVGIRESIELDLSRALAQVKQLETAVSGAVKVKGDTSQLQGELKKGGASLDDFSRRTKLSGDSIAHFGSRMTLFTTLPLVAAAGLAIKALGNWERINAQTEAAIRSTGGAANITGAEISMLGERIEKLSGLEAENVQEGANLLLTFTQIKNGVGEGNDIFSQATATLADMSVALGQDMPSAAILLGKALNDPISGVSALRKAGVQLTEQQTAQIKGFVETGDVMSAQKIVLGELTTQFGGSAEAFGTTLPGQVAKAKNAFGDMTEAMVVGALPAVRSVTGLVSGMAEGFGALPDPVQTGVVALLGIAAATGPILTVVGNIKKLQTAIVGIQWANVAAGAASIGSALGLVGIGAAAAYGSYTILKNVLGDTDDIHKAHEALEEAFKRSAGALDDTTRAAIALHIESTGLTDEFAKAGITVDDLYEAMRNAAPGEMTTEMQALWERLSAVGAKASDINPALNGTRNAFHDGAAAGKDLAAVLGQGERAAGGLGTAVGGLAAQTDEATKELDAFRDALDKTLGVTLDADEATIRYRQQVEELAEEIAAGAKEGENAAQANDRVSLSLIGVVESARSEVKALTDAGRISGDAASQTDALRARLELLKQKFPQLAPAIDGYIATLAAGAGNAGAAGEGVGRNFSEGVGRGIAQRAARAATSAVQMVRDFIAAAEAAQEQGSPSRVGMRIGGFFAEGVALGIEEQAKLAQQAARGMALGIADEVHKAAQLTNEEQLTILNSLGAVKDAEKRLSEVRADKASSVLDIRRAELELAEAQRKVNDAIYEGADASEVIEDAYERQREAVKRLRDDVNAALDTLGALSGLGGAQSALTKAERERAALQQRQGALPGELAAAEGRLTVARQKSAQVTTRESLAIVRARENVRRAEETMAKARSDEKSTADDLLEAELALVIAQEDLTSTEEEAVGVTREVEDAERDLAKLREEQTEIADQLAEANRRVTDALSGVVEAQIRLIEAGQAGQGSMEQVITTIRKLGEAAGLSKQQIDALAQSIVEANQKSSGSQGALPGGQSGDGRLIDPFTGKPAYSGPLGEGGLAANDPRISTISGLVRGTMPDGTPVYYVPGQNIQAGNVAAIAAVGRATLGPAPGAASYQPMSVNIYPKQAVYDAKSTVSTLRQLELLRR